MSVRLDVQKIACLMADRGLTATKFAERCGVSQTNVSVILNRGRCRPVTAGKLATGLGVPVSEIVEGGAADG